MNDFQRQRIIRSLEAKAASTSFPAEAESLRAKAAELRGKVAGPAPDTDGALREALEKLMADARAAEAGMRATADAASRIQGQRITAMWTDDIYDWTRRAATAEDPDERFDRLAREAREKEAAERRQRLWEDVAARATPHNPVTEEQLAEATRRAKAEADRRRTNSYTAPTNANTGARFTNVRFGGNVFEEMGGIRVNFNPDPKPTWEKGQRVRVTNVNGNTYWIDVE